MTQGLELHSNGFIETKELELYPIGSAIIHRIAACIIPPIYYVEVTGETGSLNPIIKLVTTGKIVGGYLELSVVGKDGAAIGSMEYSRSIDISQMRDTKGIIVKGSNKEVKLEWKESTQLSNKSTAGLFHLSLQSGSSLLGAPILHLNLGVDSVNEKVAGLATVTQALAKPIVCTSHVTGNLIYETVMKPGVSKIRIDLSGYPEIHWPSGGGVGPVIPKNFKAMILFDENWSNGTVQYQYRANGSWVKETQKIKII